MRQEARRLFGPIFEALSKLDDLSDDEKTRCSGLKTELSELSRKIGDFLSAAREEKISRLTSEHEQASAACRAQKTVVDEAALGSGESPT